MNDYPDALLAGSTVCQYADAIMVMVDEDIAAGKPRCGKRMPSDVGSFSELHDYRDANMYVLEAMGEVALDFGSDDASALVNAVMNEVSARLEARAPAVREQMTKTVRFAVSLGWTGVYGEHEGGHVSPVTCR